MSFQVNIPPSVISKMAQSAEGGEEAVTEETSRKKREDWKKLKELEEMRKAGTAPAMKDEEGRDINPHIPQYIMQAPWYFGTNAPTLNHQRTHPEKVKTFAAPEDWYKRGIKEGPVATKYRKGACANCGSMTHKKIDCLERPRKVGAKYTGSNIAPDEHIQPVLSHDYDGKRDRWNGYDTDDHKRLIEEFQKLEEAKKVLKAQKLENTIEVEEQQLPVDDDVDDEDKYADDVEMPGQRMDTKQRITVRNLRIREDTAKYLHNLNLESAHYDPKTRSMRENPFEQLGAASKDLPFAGDNFVRYSGGSHEMSKRQMFAWQAYEKGTDVHLQADPTKLEMLASEFKKRKEDYKTSVKDSILEKYGGEEHLQGPAKELLLAQTEEYVEYSRLGTVVKGQERAKIKSRYEEDVLINNHSCIWGSFWKNGQWGFKCCHSLIKESYCTGAAGQVAEETNMPALVEEEEPPLSLVEQHQAKIATESNKKKKKKEKKKRRKKNNKKRRKEESSSSDSSSSESEDEDEAREKRIKQAIRDEEMRVKQVNRLMKMDERKRPYNSMYEAPAPTEEELEAFRRKEVLREDPMAHFLK